MENRILKYQLDRKDEVWEHGIRSVKKDIVDFDDEIDHYKKEYNRTHSETTFFIIKGLTTGRKRLYEELNRWAYLKNLALRRRSEAGVK